MWNLFGRTMLAVWFIGAIGLGIWSNERNATAQQGEQATLYLPMVHQHYDWGIKDYIGLVDTGEGYFTVRGDGSQWQRLTSEEANIGAWSPNGKHFVYLKWDSGEVYNGWMVDLETRQPYFVARSQHRYPIWSPDNRYIAFVARQAVSIFDTQTMTLQTFAKSGDVHSLVWSPNSNHLAWTGNNLEGDRELWLWSMDEPLAHQVMVNRANYAFELFWSPNGNHLMFNTKRSVTHNGIFVTSMEGETPTLLLEDAYMEGWVEGGERIVLRHSGNLYLALPDTTDQTLFYEGVSRTPGNVLISPQGDHLLFYGDYGRQYVQSTNATTAALVEFGDCSHVSQWQKQGDLVSCSSIQGSYTGYLGLKVGDGTAMPMTPDIELPQHLYPQFLTGPTPYMATHHFGLRQGQGGYPVLDSYQGSYLFNLQSGGLKRISYPNDTSFRVLEWRYMP